MNTTDQPGDTTALPATPGSAGLGTFSGAFSTPPDARTGVDLAQLGPNLSYSRKLTEQFSVGVGATPGLSDVQVEWALALWHAGCRWQPR